jgi:signal transduction histidine kinase
VAELVEATPILPSTPFCGMIKQPDGVTQPVFCQPIPCMSVSATLAAMGRRFHGLPYLAQLALLVGLYWLCAHISTVFGIAPGSISPVWPLAGLTLAALVLYGPGLLLAIFLGDTLAGSLSAGFPFLTSLGISSATTLEVALGWYLLGRMLSERPRFDRLRDVLAFSGVACFAPLVGGALAVLSLLLGGRILLAEYLEFFVTWWVGDALGMLVFAPVVLNWLAPGWQPRAAPALVEQSAFTVLSLSLTAILFQWFPNQFYFLLLLTVFAALRYGPGGAAHSTALISLVALERTLAGVGPFVLEDRNASLIAMQIFIAVVGVTSLLVSAINRHRQQLADADALIADVSQTFYQSLDYGHTLNHVSRRLAGTMADWVMIDLIDGQQTIPAARTSAHANQAALAEALKRYPPRLQLHTSDPLARILLAGQTQYYPVVPESLRQEVAQTDEHLAMIHAMDIQSAIIAPLRLEQRVIGLLTLCRGSRRPRFLPDDVLLVERIAANAARAIENAQLHSTLQHTLAQLDTLLNSVPVGVALFDSELICRRINPAFATLMELPIDQCEGRAFTELIPTSVGSIWAMINALMAGAEQPQPVELVLSEGRLAEQRTLLVSAYRVAHPSAALGLGLVVVDLTFSRRMEQRLRESERLESVGRFSGGIAHDFNGILTVILGAAELLSDTFAGSPDDLADLDRLRAAAQHGKRLTQQLMLFARNRPDAPQTILFDAMISEPIELLHRLLPRSIQLTFVPGAAQSYVHIDPARFAQVIMNLGINSRDAMPEGGSLRVSSREVILDSIAIQQYGLEQTGSYVLLEVADSGIGMDSATQARIFEPYFTTKSNGKGFGLGLATVYGIVRQNGGSITLRSAPDAGTTFSIYIPCVAYQPEANP